MDDQKVSVLPMDDEIASADPVRRAVAALEDSGFVVDAVDSIHKARRAFYRGEHRVFVLDIDMSRIDDGGTDAGTEVSRFVRGLSAEAGLVVYSARGGVSSWFGAANHHVDGYVWKTERHALDTLVQRVRQAAERPPQPRAVRPTKPPPLLLAAAFDPDRYPVAMIERAAGEALPGWQVRCVDDLACMERRLSGDRQRPGAVLALWHDFSGRPAAVRRVEAICAAAPAPHAVLGCAGEHGAMGPILSLVNARPFRLVDTLSPTFNDDLVEALKSAAAWHGRHEALPAADPNDLAELELGLSEETRAELGDNWIEDDAEDDRGDPEAELDLDEEEEEATS